MKLSNMITLIVTAGMFFTGQAYAQETPTASKAEHVMKADTDNDGKISREEFRTAQEARGDKRFQRLDANNDGFIDQAERKAAYSKKCTQRHRHDMGGKGASS